jgi:hypothetical protein
MRALHIEGIGLAVEVESASECSIDRSGMIDSSSGVSCGAKCYPKVLLERRQKTSSYVAGLREEVWWDALIVLALWQWESIEIVYLVFWRDGVLIRWCWWFHDYGRR